MKKSVCILFFLFLLGASGLFAQSVVGRYTHSQELNTEEIEINQIVLSYDGSNYSANWEYALATGLNESIVALQNVVVDEQTLRISFEKDGTSHDGQFVSDGEGGYDLVIDNQTMYSRVDW